jgi:hypothetical protein
MNDLLKIKVNNNDDINQRFCYLFHSVDHFVDTFLSEHTITPSAEMINAVCMCICIY